MSATSVLDQPSCLLSSCYSCRSKHTHGGDALSNGQEARQTSVAQASLSPAIRFHDMSQVITVDDRDPGIVYSQSPPWQQVTTDPVDEFDATKSGADSVGMTASFKFAGRSKQLGNERSHELITNFIDDQGHRSPSLAQSAPGTCTVCQFRATQSTAGTERHTSHPLSTQVALNPDSFSINHHNFPLESTS